MLHAKLSFAQQLNLSITPPHLEVIIKPGKSVLVAYTVQNLGDPVVIKPRVLPFVARDTIGGIAIQEEFTGPVRFGLDNSDIQLDQPFFLDSNKSQQLILRIRLPEGAPEEDYYYTFFVESQPPPSLEGLPSSRTQARIGTNILITVTNTDILQAAGKINLFDVLPRFKIGELKLFDSADKIPVVLLIGNTGKNLLKPSGQIVLKGNFGEKATYNLVPENVLSQSQRVIEATPSAEVDCENNRAIYCTKPVSLIISGFFIGNYKLSVNVNFGEGNQDFFAATSFIALPIKFLFGVVVVLIASIFLIKRFKQ